MIDLSTTKNVRISVVDTPDDRYQVRIASCGTEAMDGEDGFEVRSQLKHDRYEDAKHETYVIAGEGEIDVLFGAFDVVWAGAACTWSEFCPF